MSTIHLTNGDVAAESLRAALAEAGRDDRVHALRDDLAVGPLRGIDDGPEVRADSGTVSARTPRRDFLREFREQAAALETHRAAAKQSGGLARRKRSRPIDAAPGLLPPAQQPAATE